MENLSAFYCFDEIYIDKQEKRKGFKYNRSTSEFSEQQ